MPCVVARSIRQAGFETGLRGGLKFQLRLPQSTKCSYPSKHTGLCRNECDGQRDKRMKRRVCGRQPAVDWKCPTNMDKKVTKPYRMFMKYFDDVKYPSMSLDSDDITEESIYRSVDELLRSHLYSSKTALPCMGRDKLILWLAYDFFELKKITEKLSCERIEISDNGLGGEKKTSWG